MHPDLAAAPAAPVLVTSPREKHLTSEVPNASPGRWRSGSAGIHRAPAVAMDPGAARFAALSGMTRAWFLETFHGARPEVSHSRPWRSWPAAAAVCAPVANSSVSLALTRISPAASSPPSTRNLRAGDEARLVRAEEQHHLLRPPSGWPWRLIGVTIQFASQWPGRASRWKVVSQIWPGWIEFSTDIPVDEVHRRALGQAAQTPFAGGVGDCRNARSCRRSRRR